VGDGSVTLVQDLLQAVVLLDAAVPRLLIVEELL